VREQARLTGLDLIGRLLLSPGDRVLVEAPTYIGALRAFDTCEAAYGAHCKMRSI
jgi:2-aminoadipate transaminase